MWLFFVVAGVVALAHTAPFPFILEYLARDGSIWRMPSLTGVPTVYLTYDDGPNPEATPALLEVLRREGVRATFFVIPAHVTTETAPIVQQAFEDGHGIALQSNTRSLVLKRSAALASLLADQAQQIERLAGSRPCLLFRPHAGWRGGEMYGALKRAGYTLAGWSWGMWDWNWWRAPDPQQVAKRLASRASNGDIIVMHDGHHKDPRADRRRTVETTAALIPLLKARGFSFANLCDALRPGVNSPVAPRADRPSSPATRE